MRQGTFELSKFDVKKFDSILAKGLSHGLGRPENQVCIEAAICQTLGLPHGDDPGCVSAAVRYFKIKLNDSPWSSPAARAKGLRDLGIAQLGSKGVVNDEEFAKRLAEKTIRVLIPKIFRSFFPKDEKLLALALRCEEEGTADAAYAAANAATAAYAVAAYAAYAAANAAYAAYAANAAANAAYAANAANAAYAAAYAANAAAYAANAANANADAAAYAAAAYEKGDEYLNLSAKLALEVLRELKSPGIDLL